MSKYGIISNRRRARDPGPRFRRRHRVSLLAPPFLLEPAPLSAPAIYHEGLVRAGVMAVWPLMILDIQHGINHCLCLYCFLPATRLTCRGFLAVLSLSLWQIACSSLFWSLSSLIRQPMLLRGPSMLLDDENATFRQDRSSRRSLTTESRARPRRQDN